MEINVLITSVSRKVWLVKAFKDALKDSGLSGRVISTDINPMSCGLYVSDAHYLVPQSNDKDFIPRIQDICKKEKIGIIIPTRDGELELFAQTKAAFEAYGVDVMVSSSEVIDVCTDKHKFYKFLTDNDIPTPKTFCHKI
jgi:Carbamoylphosphate synthase large subunit (split gene in MJ)